MNNIKIPLSEIATVVAGQSPESKYYSESGVPFLQGNRTFGRLYPSIDSYTTRVTKHANINDILISVRAPVGDINIANKYLCIGRGLAAVSPKPNVDYRFLYYSLLYNVNTLIKRQSGGTTFSSVNKSAIEQLELIIPADVSSREKLTNFLWSVDEKIELNNMAVNELERIARLVYNYWFVQFDFPDANNKPYKTSGGKMVYNKYLKCDIPENWKTYSIAQLIANSKNGDWGSASKLNSSDMKIYCIRGADINALNGSGILDPPHRYILSSHSNRLLSADDLVVEISGGSPVQSTGRMAHIADNVLKRFNFPLVCSNFCKAISLNNKKHSYLVEHHWNRLYDAGIFFNFEGKTSGIKNLLFDQVAKDIYIALPDDETLVNRFYEYSSSVDSIIQNNLAQNKELTRLRDWLLPVLMNGQAKVSNKELQ